MPSAAPWRDLPLSLACALLARMTIAFFGMGLLGSNFVRALRKRGESVNVWNRSAAKASALEAEGAKAFADPAEAARGCVRLHLTLSDDAAVDEVLESARGGLGPDAVIVDHTTTTARGATARVDRWRQRGVTFLHAPVFMGPQNARESTGLMLTSGDRALIAPLEAALSAMTGKLVYVGERVDAAASMKLLGNLFLMFLTSGMAEMLALAKGLGVPSEQAATLFDHFNPGMMVPARMKRMLEGQFTDPSWELRMARKDARLMIEEATTGDVQLTMLPAIAARMDALIASGHGGDDWTVLAKDYIDR